MTTSIHSTKTLAATILCTFILLGTGCAGSKKSTDTSEDASSGAVKSSPETELSMAQNQIVQLQSRLQDLETRLGAMNEKMNLQLQSDGPIHSQANSQSKIVQTPAASAAIGLGSRRPKGKTSATSSDESVMTQNEAVDRYREAKILYESNRLSDSIIELADFVKNFPMHVLAPAAQYLMGMAYYKQNEYTMAEEEWNRLLIAYPHSQYTADGLRALAEVSLILKKPEKSNYYQQKLKILFSNSPQSKMAFEKPPSIKATTAPASKPTTLDVADPQVETIETIPSVPDSKKSSTPDGEHL
jgi:TolA-binding protein